MTSKTVETELSEPISNLSNDSTKTDFITQFNDFMEEVNSKITGRTILSVNPDTFESKRVILRPPTDYTSKDGVTYQAMVFAYEYPIDDDPTSPGIEAPLIYDFQSQDKNVVLPSTGVVWSKPKNARQDAKEEPNMRIIFNVTNEIQKKIINDINSIFEMAKVFIRKHVANKPIGGYTKSNIENVLVEPTFKSPIFFPKDMEGNFVDNGRCNMYAKIDNRMKTATKFIDVMGRSLEPEMLKEVPCNVVPQFIFTRVSLVQTFHFQYIMRSCLVMEADPDGSNHQLQALANLVNEEVDDIKRSIDNIDHLRKAFERKATISKPISGQTVNNAPLYQNSSMGAMGNINSYGNMPSNMMYQNKPNMMYSANSGNMVSNGYGNSMPNNGYPMSSGNYQGSSSSNQNMSMPHMIANHPTR